MITFLKKYGLWLAGIAGVFLLIIAFRGCNPAPSHKDEKKSLDSAQVKYKAAKDSMKLVIADLTYRNETLQRAYDTIHHQRDSLGRVVKDGVVKLQAAIKRGQEAKDRGDTASVVRSWDTVTGMVNRGIPAIVKADTLDQQMVDNHNRQMAIKDSAIAALTYLWHFADDNYAGAKKAYDGLYHDYGDLNRQFKFNKTLSRGLAIALLAAVAKIFILK
jgi:hypothetical protein